MEAMPNRLATSASLYLRQHADNPVDWFPWGDEAFAKALGEGKPVFLSVGYSSCHWCHVMAHESFEDDGVATILNEHFVSIKLDREERPDVDEAYMAAVQLATSRGGWPMTVFMTPEREPFFAGTYFPREDRGQSPGFVSIIKGISEGWKSNRKEFEEAASEFAASMRDVIAQAPPDSQSGLHSGLLLGAIGALHHDFDPRFAGFGGAPKFPPHTAIEFCLKFAGSDTAAEDRDLAMHMANATLMAMAAGGIRDHVGGGFHRYATDQTWGLPHFEKMLVDNALMLSNYALAARVTGNAGYKRVAEEIIEWLEREMKLDGLYCSALDADTEGEEGKTYTWTWKEIHALLGERAVPFMEAYGFAPNGNFDDEATGERTGGNIPMLEFAQAVQNVEFEAELRMLLAARLKRPQPARDDKAIVGHNGLLMAALAQAGRMDLAACLASRLSTFFVSNADVSLRIPRYIGWTKEPDSYSLSGYGVEPIEGSIHAEPHGDGFLEDYAGVAYGFTVLAELDPEGSWMDAARDLAQLMLQKFWNSSASAFFTTGEHQEVLFGRVRPIFDQPAPSATALAARALLRTGYLSEARQVLAGVAGWMERAPQATEALHTAYLELHSVKPISFPHDDGVQMWIEWQHYPRGGTMHFSIPAGWHISREALRITAKFPIKLLLLGMQGEGNWDVPFILNVPERWTGKVNMVVRWQICTDKECLPWAERQHQLVVS